METIQLNTQEFSQEEKKILEDSSAFEFYFYNLRGDKQYTFPKKILMKELTSTVQRINNQIMDVKVKSLISTFVLAIGLLLLAGIVSTMINNPFAVILPVAYLYAGGYLFLTKWTQKKIKELETEKEVRENLIEKIEEKSTNQNKKNTKVIENIQQENQALETTIKEENKNSSLEISANSDIISNIGEKAQNISNNEVTVKKELNEKEIPKKMVKGKK